MIIKNLYTDHDNDITVVYITGSAHESSIMRTLINYVFDRFPCYNTPYLDYIWYLRTQVCWKVLYEERTERLFIQTFSAYKAPIMEVVPGSILYKALYHNVLGRGL